MTDLERLQLVRELNKLSTEELSAYFAICKDQTVRAATWQLILARRSQYKTVQKDVLQKYQNEANKFLNY